MSWESIDRLISGKREQHPELRKPLTWTVLQTILKRESIAIYSTHQSRPARLIHWDGSLTILLSKDHPKARWLAYAVHELAHIWKHIDAATGRFETCFNYSYPENTDPREDEADYIAHALLYGPRFDQLVVPAKWLKQRRIEPSVVEIVGDGSFTLPAVGTAQKPRQRALEAICGGRSMEGVDVRAPAVLRCEDDNPHDDQAVRIEIHGKHVGYLSRANARKYRQQFGRREVRCSAKVTGGWARGGTDMGCFGVRLDLKLEAQPHG